jgi:chromosome segregation ATPase
MNFFSNVYQRTKLAFSGIGVAGSTTTIIVGIVATKGLLAIPLIIGGISWLCVSSISLVETMSTYSLIKKDIDRLRKNITDFENENFELKSNIATMRGDLKKLKEVRLAFIEENKKLVTSLRESEKQILKMNDLVNENRELLTQEKLNVQSLEGNVQYLQKVRESFKDENNKLKTMNEDNLAIINSLENIKDEYVRENDELKKINQDSSEQLIFLENQVTKLKQLYVNTKQLMKNIVNASSTFSDISEDINKSAQNLDNTNENYNKTLDQMQNLLERLKDKTFDDLDINDDGIITEEEFDVQI